MDIPVPFEKKHAVGAVDVNDLVVDVAGRCPPFVAQLVRLRHILATSCIGEVEEMPDVLPAEIQIQVFVDKQVVLVVHKPLTYQTQ